MCASIHRPLKTRRLRRPAIWSACHRWPFRTGPNIAFHCRIRAKVKRDLAAFAPNIMHISRALTAWARQAVKWARNRNLPVLCSVHTRFETYFRYYNMSFAEPLVVAWLRRLYRKCDALVAPSESYAQVLREQRMNYDIDIWSTRRGPGHFQSATP